MKGLDNRGARHKFRIEKEMEAGICLSGSEVKAIRIGRAAIGDSFALFKRGELFLVNFHIGDYPQAIKSSQHAPRRERKLLLHKKELSRLSGSVQRGGMTLVPLRLFFNARGIAKINLGLGKGLAKADRRADIAERDWQRRKVRLTHNRAIGGDD